MHQSTAHVERIAALSATLAEVRVACPARVIPQPGQLVLARRASDCLREMLFPRTLYLDGFTFEISVGLEGEPRWNPGAPLDLLGPVGRPLSMPKSTRRLLLIDGGPGPGRLLPFIHAGLALKAAATLLLNRVDYPVESLPAEVEVRTGDLASELVEALAWADLVVADPGETGWPVFQTLLEAAPTFPARPLVYVLNASPMPCGVGACRACAVSTDRRWHYACVDGPFLEWAPGVSG